jgi:Arc/MetJ-type ribon-helix-helix transcriptional regulator
VTRKGRMRIVAVYLPEEIIELIDQLVKDGCFRSRCAAVRYLLSRAVTEEILRVMGK